jgi:hypothetical protein
MVRPYYSWIKLTPNPAKPASLDCVDPRFDEGFLFASRPLDRRRPPGLTASKSRCETNAQQISAMFDLAHRPAFAIAARRLKERIKRGLEAPS